MPRQLYRLSVRAVITSMRLVLTAFAGRRVQAQRRHTKRVEAHERVLKELVRQEEGSSIAALEEALSQALEASRSQPRTRCVVDE